MQDYVQNMQETTLNGAYANILKHGYKMIVGVYRQAGLGIPLAVKFVGRDRLLWNSMVQGT